MADPNSKVHDDCVSFIKKNKTELNLKKKKSESHFRWSQPK